MHGANAASAQIELYLYQTAAPEYEYTIPVGLPEFGVELGSHRLLHGVLKSTSGTDQMARGGAMSSFKAKKKTIRHKAINKR